MTGMTPIDPFMLRSAAQESPMAKSAGPSGGDKGFGDLLTDMVKETNQAQKTSDASMQDFLTGKTQDAHDVIIALNKADLSFRMMLEVRNKLLDSYQEVMRMQV